MAVADPLPVAPNHGSSWTTFSRYNPMRRNETPAKHQPLWSLESLAAELTWLSTSPTGGFTYLSGELYAETSTPYASDQRSRVKKSRSFPTVRRDSTDSSQSRAPLEKRRSKSVRFADSQGLPLVQAVHRLTSADSSYTECKIVPYDDDAVFFVPTLTGPSNKKVNPLSKDKNGCTPPVSPKQSSPTHKRSFQFTQPSSEPGFFKRVRIEHVALETIREESRSLHGVVRVSNIAYDKEVTVRWTHDNWKSSHDTNAVFCASHDSTDRFSFELPVNGDDVMFAIRYRCNGQEYWDSNKGQNYVISVKQ